MLFGLKIKKLKWKIKMNEKTLRILLSKLNIHLNDLDIHNLYAYLINVQCENNGGRPENFEFDIKSLERGVLVFNSLNGL